MEFQKDYPLSNFTSFHVGGLADYFCVVSSLDHLRQALSFAATKHQAVLMLGGGSNVLVADAGFRGVAIAADFKGIEVLRDTADEIEIRVGTGEIWDEVVLWAVEKNFWGLENLSAIPGKTGAIPIGNVGAYGAEASFVVTNVEAWELSSRTIKNFSNQEIGFAYRQSNFNTIWKNQYVILSVTFKLQKNPKPNLSYVDVQKYFENQPEPSIREIRRAIIEIRSQKFPEIAITGNAGSFFKNFLLSRAEVNNLDNQIARNFPAASQQRYAEIKRKFPVAGAMKIPAAFIIDICGLKGRQVGGAQLWEKQPLVIVNTGVARASDIAVLFRLVRQEVQAKTGLVLLNEPEFVGFTNAELEHYFQLS